MGLRADLIRAPRADGGLDLYDPLLRRLHCFDSEWIPEEELRARLLLEGPEIERVRAQILTAERAREPRVVQWEHASPPEEIWALAADLPPGVTPAWRRPEPWRRLGEERLAGRTLLILRELVKPELLVRARAALERGPWRPADGGVVVGWWYYNDVLHEDLLALRALLLDPGLRALLGAALGVVLPGGLVLNGWRLEPGDRFRLHPDGPHYVATFALGLEPGWRASDGGAIAFGEPHPDGMIVRERWLPFLGDLCVFLPQATSWHLVEPPARTRTTLSGWWVNASGSGAAPTSGR